MDGAQANFEAKSPADKPLAGWFRFFAPGITIFAVFALCAAWWVHHHRLQQEQQQQVLAARNQTRQGDYLAAAEIWQDLLKRDRNDPTALDGQLRNAMLWVENFKVSNAAQNADQLAAQALDFIFPVLESGLTRAHGVQAADIQAHLGWAHWLNQHIVNAEFGPVAEENLHAALQRDPGNPYANAMLGNWLLHNNGDFSQAVACLHTAVASGRARAFVRRLQFGALVGLNHDGARAEMMKAANQMRLSGEVLDPKWRQRAVAWCCDPVVTTRPELEESLSSLPPDEAWQTYLWLDATKGQESAAVDRPFAQRIVQATLLEVTGQKQQSLAQFRQLQKDLATRSGAMKDLVDDAVRRLQREG